MSSFVLQPGTYQVQFSSTVGGCGSVTPFVDNIGVVQISTSGTCAQPEGIMASAFILKLGLNQALVFLVDFNPLTFVFGKLIFTKLE